MSEGVVPVAAFEKVVRRAERERIGRLKAEELMEVKYREIYRTNEKLEQIAFNDALTGLGNRYWIQREFERLGQEGDREVCLLFLNLDWFKRINDSLGHKTGDDALKQIATRIADPGIPAKNAHAYKAARLSGDEFVVLVAQGSSMLDWLAIGEDLRRRVSEVIELEGTHVTINASVGLSAADLINVDFERLVNEADIAMRKAKSDGNHRAQFYDPGLGYRSSGAVALEEGIRLGLDRGEFVAHYQPKVDIVTGEIKGGEALVRWNHPEAGVLGPARFLSTAEGSDLVNRIGSVVLSEVVAFQRRAMLKHAAMPISINISAREFGSQSLAFEIGHKVAQAGLPANLIVLEITEGSVAGDPTQFALLNLLRGAGFKVSIDDFGVAQSSLSRLREIPKDEVKIDKSFIDGVPGNAVDGSILRAVISLASATGSQVVIEGVEHEEQLEFLRGLEPVWVQGYVYSRPVPADEYLSLLLEQPWKR